MAYHIFYAEIRNQIASEFCKNPSNLSEDEMHGLFTLCAEAAWIFYAILDISGYAPKADMAKLTKHYSGVLLDRWSKGHTPTSLDLIILAAEALQSFC